MKSRLPDVATNIPQTSSLLLRVKFYSLGTERNPERNLEFLAHIVVNGELAKSAERDCSALPVKDFLSNAVFARQFAVADIGIHFNGW